MQHNNPRRRPHNGMQQPHRRNNNSGRRGGHHSGPPRARKNYRVLMEKYQNMAKDAMSNGDRILAEYYLQHADHYFRMQQEFMEERARWQQQNPNEAAAAEEFENEGAEASEEDSSPDVDIPNNSNVLPAFLTRKVEGKSAPAQAPEGEWEGQA